MRPETVINAQDNFLPSSLHHLVDRVTTNMAPAVKQHKSLIINNVPESICSEANEKVVSSILSSLMNVVVMHTEHSCIRISAKMVGNVILLHVKDDGALNYDSISHNLAEMKSEAEKIGGSVGFTSYRNKLTTIAFSFLNS